MKAELIELSKKKVDGKQVFKSQFFSAEEWKHSNKEPMRYFLWMTEFWMSMNNDLEETSKTMESELLKLKV